jgi:glycosyltransferase involved in cell wall biosynthesis
MSKTSRFKTGFVIDDLGYGGAQRQLTILVEALSRTAQPCVFCLSQSTKPFADKIRDAGIDVVVVPRSRGFDVKRLNHLARAFVEMDVDVVHGFLDAANVYAWAASRRARVPCVLSLRNEQLRLRGFRRLVLHQSLRWTNFVTANSQAGRRFLIDELSLSPARVAVIPNAVVPPAALAPERLPTPAVFGFVGRLNRQKRVDILLDAFAEAGAQLKDAKLVLVGDGPQRASAIDRARRLGIEHRVQFTGLVDDVEQHMVRFSCVVLPSAYEGLPNVALEAVALGVPVVAADVGDVGDIIIDDRTGYLWRTSTTSELADLMVRAATNEALRKRSREEGPALIREKYSVDAAVGKLLSVYEKAVEK